jgi:hypothetical protein
VTALLHTASNKCEDNHEWRKEVGKDLKNVVKAYFGVFTGELKHFGDHGSNITYKAGLYSGIATKGL